MKGGNCEASLSLPSSFVLHRAICQSAQRRPDSLSISTTHNFSSPESSVSYVLFRFPSTNAPPVLTRNRLFSLSSVKCTVVAAGRLSRYVSIYFLISPPRHRSPPLFWSEKRDEEEGGGGKNIPNTWEGLRRGWREINSPLLRLTPGAALLVFSCLPKPFACAPAAADFLPLISQQLLFRSCDRPFSNPPPPSHPRD